MRTGLALGAAALLLTAPGCAGLSQRDCERRGTCDSDGGTTNNEINLQVTTPRIARNMSGTLGLRAEVFQPTLDVSSLKVELRQGDQSVVVPVTTSDLAAGTLQPMVDGNLLGQFQIGPVDVAVSVGGQRGAGRLFLYVAPRLDAELVYDYGTAGNNGTPLRLLVTKAGPVLVWEQYTAIDDKRRVREYSMDKQSMKLAMSNTIAWLSDANVDFTFTSQGSAAAQVGLGRSDLVVAYPRSGQPYNLIRCQLINANPKPCGAAADTGLTVVTAAALDPSGAVAVLANPTTLKGFQGTSNAAVAISGAPTATTVLTAADLDNDGTADLLVLDNSGAATVLLGKDGALNQDAALTAEITNRLKDAGAIVTATVADVDGDGLGDLALVTKASPKEVRVSYNLGTGSFDAPRVLATSGSAVTSLSAGDVDGDNDADLVIAASAERRLGLFVNRP